MSLRKLIRWGRYVQTWMAWILIAAGFGELVFRHTKPGGPYLAVALLGLGTFLLRHQSSQKPPEKVGTVDGLPPGCAQSPRKLDDEI